MPTFDATSSFDTTHSASPATGSITVGAGSDPAIVIAVHDSFSTTETLTGFSSDLDGADVFTKVDAVVGAGGRVYQWILEGASTGTHTITPIFSDSGGESVGIIMSSYHDVDPTTPTGTPNTASGTSNSPSVTVTTASGELVVDTLGIFGAGVTPTEGANQTEMDADGNPHGGVGRVAHSRQAGADGGVMSWSLPSSEQWGMVAVSLKPAADTTAPTLTSPSGTATGETTADLSVDSDEDCDAAVVVTQSSTTPTDTQINAGQDHTGAAADYDEALTGQTAGTINFAGATGLSAGTEYWAHFAAEDAAANKATPVTSSSFTTDSAGGASLTDSPLINSPLLHSRLIR